MNYDNPCDECLCPGCSKKPDCPCPDTEMETKMGCPVLVCIEKDRHAEAVQDAMNRMIDRLGRMM